MFTNDYLQIAKDSLSGQVHTLHRLAAGGAICLLEDCVDRLNILGNLKRKLQVKPDIEYRSLKERIGNDFCSRIFNEETMQVFEEKIDDFKSNKLQEDRGYVEKVLQKTLTELIDHTSFESIIKCIEGLKLATKEEEKLYEDQVFCRNKIRELELILESEKNDKLRTIKDVTRLASKLKDEAEDMEIEIGITMRTVNRWELARQSQTRLKYTVQDNDCIKEQMFSQMKLDQEIRVHSEIMIYNELIYTELEDSIKLWRSKYDIDIDHKELTIVKLISDKENLITLIRNLALAFQSHRTKMDQWLKEVEERKRQAALIKKQNQTAVKIQAWWRGIRVRRRLGPFKKIFKTFDESKRKLGKKK